MKKYKRFKGSATEYINLHNRIKGKKGIPSKCYLCDKADYKLELANLTQKYTEDLSDWAYMCGSCHKRYDSPKYHWKKKTKEWNKYCTSCKKIMPEERFYKRQGKVIATSNGKEYEWLCSTTWCKKCTKIWSKSKRNLTPILR